MITLTIDLLAKGVTLIVLFILIASIAKAQTAAGDVFTTVTYLPTTFGWQAPYWVKTSDSANMLSSYMRTQTAQDSITNMKATIATKLPTANFTKAAMVALGMMAYTDTSAILNPYLRSNVAAATYLTSASISGKLDNTLTSGRIFVGNGSNVAIGVALSGDATMANTGALTLNTVNSNVGTFNGSYTVNAKGLITAATNTSFNATPARVLSTTGSNNTFTISATKNARVTYTVNFSVALALVTSNGLVSLDYSTDGGSNWTTVATVSNAYTVAVTLTGNWDNVLSGEIPANALVRIYRSANTNVTVTLPTTKQQEVTY